MSFENILENHWTRWRVFATYTCSRGKTDSTQEPNQNTPSAPQTPQIQVNQEEANLITFTPIVEQQVPPVQGATGIQEQPKRQRSLRKKKNSEWTLNQKQFNYSKTQEILHILPGEHLNVFNGEESVSYLQLPVKKKEENRFCTRCGEMGHGRCHCQANTWCKFCIMDTHAMRACRKYEKFVKDNPIASSRRNTPVQVQGQRAAVNPQERPQQPLFPHPPVQRYNPTVIPQIAMHNLAPQAEEHESRGTFLETATKPNEGGMDPDVKTTSSPKKLSGRSYGSTLPETSTVCRDKLSPTLSTDASRSKQR